MWHFPFLIHRWIFKFQHTLLTVFCTLRTNEALDGLSIELLFRELRLSEELVTDWWTSKQKTIEQTILEIYKNSYVNNNKQYYFDIYLFTYFIKWVCNWEIKLPSMLCSTVAESCPLSLKLAVRRISPALGYVCLSFLDVSTAKKRMGGYYTFPFLFSSTLERNSKQ